MSINSNDNISKIAKLTTRELPHLAKTAKITVRENNGVYSILSSAEAPTLSIPYTGDALVPWQTGGCSQNRPKPNCHGN